MFRINTEYRKGVLFIRLKGRFDKTKYKKINKLIDTLGINFIVLNLSELKYISLDDIKCIENQNKNILKKKKHLLIYDKEIRNNLFNNITKINNEIEAFSLI